ncbi:endonuclease/exonuclease/phosphatase family protein [Echinicola sp. CAU 1574]|uniref:Endonuclease/exonuclease/phosphatase family protein n=1 Tax=Echinicola arenosa TaxID=2774144 RepID=A0ABR9AK43_9BACT|nr:endonuclease/exonuclease/phosphatase family protein [Echinicola arenosa]MBD8489142.1 endonuclease/exonuclease/phosphatase family protein [Echinicola arenosa]
MKQFLSILFFTCNIISLQAQQKSDTLTVISYNLRFGEKASMREFSEFIKEQDADLVALQEVDIKTFRERAPHQNGKDFMGELAYYTGMFAAFGKTIDHAGGYYGIGLLSKYPINSVERILLPFTENGKEQRAFLVANIDLPQQSIIFVSTHLDYTNTEERQLQVQAINKKLTDNKKPILLCGDFNARPKSTEIQVDMNKWILLDNGKPTASSDEPKYKIDYIFGYPKISWELLHSDTPPKLLSDHLPIVSKVIVHW